MSMLELNMCISLSLRQRGVDRHSFDSRFGFELRSRIDNRSYLLHNLCNRDQLLQGREVKIPIRMYLLEDIFQVGSSDIVHLHMKHRKGL